MPGREYSFDTSDVDSDLQAEAEARKKQEQGREIEGVKQQVAEIQKGWDEVVDLTEDDIELIGEEAELMNDVSEDGSELKQLLNEIKDEVNGETEIQASLKDVKALMNDMSSEQAQQLGEFMIAQDSPQRAAERALERSDRAAAKKYDTAVKDIDADYGARLAALQSEYTRYQNFIARDPSVRSLYGARMTELLQQAAILKEERGKKIEAARQEYEHEITAPEMSVEESAAASTTEAEAVPVDESMIVEEGPSNIIPISRARATRPTRPSATPAARPKNSPPPPPTPLRPRATPPPLPTRKAA